MNQSHTHQHSIIASANCRFCREVEWHSRPGGIFATRSRYFAAHYGKTRSISASLLALVGLGASVLIASVIYLFLIINTTSIVVEKRRMEAQVHKRSAAVTAVEARYQELEGSLTLEKARELGLKEADTASFVGQIAPFTVGRQQVVSSDE